MKIMILLFTLLTHSIYAEINMQEIPQTPQIAPTIFYGKIVAIAEGMGYQYLNIDENNITCWVAIAHAPVKVGDIVGYEKKIIMHNFKSKSLDKKFNTIIFSPTLYPPQYVKTSIPIKLKPSIEKTTNLFIPKEFYTIEEAYRWREHLKGKTIKVKGTIRKISKHIMQLNWVHLVDGTGTFKEQNSDLIFTTKTLTFKEGDKVVATGKVVTDKDLGYGYFYKILVQESGFVGE